MGAAFALRPLLSPRPWGGARLSALLGITCAERIGEAWLASGASEIIGGSFAGRPLADAVRQQGPELVGAEPYRRYAVVLPLIVKLLDTADWLSVHVCIPITRRCVSTWRRRSRSTDAGR